MVLSVPSRPAVDTAPAHRYRSVRQWSESLCQPLATEDYVIQTMPDVSPPKWHLAHTTWFFETFILQPHLPGYQLFHDRYCYLFNSYYEAVGERHPRPQRGLLARPTVAEIYAYRAFVDEAMEKWLDQLENSLENPLENRLENCPDRSTLLALLELGLHHEQQHQELLLTDIKHIFGTHPLFPLYRPLDARASEAIVSSDCASSVPLGWQVYEPGLYDIGHHAAGGFAFDNEGPPHRTYLQGFALADRLVTCGEYLAFMQAGGVSKSCVLAFGGLAQNPKPRLASASVLARSPGQLPGGCSRRMVDSYPP